MLSIFAPINASLTRPVGSLGQRLALTGHTHRLHLSRRLRMLFSAVVGLVS